MKILVINPNSDSKMTENMEKSLENYKKNDIKLIFKTLENAPSFINSHETIAQVGIDLIETVKEYDSQVDGFIVACHLDPMLDAAKEVTNKPVIGIGEASMKVASMICDKFSVIGSSSKTVELKTNLVKKYGLLDKLASVRYITEEEESYEFNDAMAHIAKRAVDEDSAEIIVLGCAGFSGLDTYIEEKIGRCVLDGVVCAYYLLTGLLEYKAK